MPVQFPASRIIGSVRVIIDGNVLLFTYTFSYEAVICYPFPGQKTGYCPGPFPGERQVVIFLSHGIGMPDHFYR